MSLNATFVGDFANFETAVQNAVVKLRGFETGASQVNKSLSSMTDSFSGRKVVTDATLMVEAIDRIGGASKLTQKELERVGASANEAVAKLRALGQDVPPKLQLLADSTKAASKWMTDLGTSVVSTAAGFISAQAAINLATSAFRTFSDFVGDSVKAFGEAERAQAKLVASLRAQGEATPAVIDRMNELATQFQRTTVYGDDLINEMEALLTTVGKVMPQDMERALEASTNLAAGLGKDLTEATMLVAKAAVGHTEALGKLGISFEKTGDQGKNLDRVLNGINQQFGGQAAAQLDTYDGRIKQMGNSWNNVQEAVGKLLTTSPLARKSLDLIAEGLQHVDAESGKMTVSWADLAETLMTKDVAAFIAYAESVVAAEYKTTSMTAATQAANATLGDTAVVAKAASENLKALGEMHEAAVAAAGKRWADLAARIVEIEGKTEAGLLGLSKAEQQETQRAMENAAAKYAQVAAHEKLIEATLKEAAVAANANAARLSGPDDPIMRAAMERDAAMARADKAFPEGGEQSSAIYQHAADTFQDAVNKFTAAQPTKGFNAGQVPFSQLATPTINVNVSGVLDPRTIKDLSSAVGQEWMSQSNRFYPPR